MADINDNDGAMGAMFEEWDRVYLRVETPTNAKTCNGCAFERDIYKCRRAPSCCIQGTLGMRPLRTLHFIWIVKA